MRMMNRLGLRAIFQGQAGEGILTGLYSMLLATMIFFIGIDIAGYTATVWKMRNACTETLTLMKVENGFDSNTKQLFYELVQKQGLDSSRVEVSGTAKSVQRGEQVTLRATAPYILRALRPIGQELSFQVKVEITGLAQDFLRKD